MLINFYSPKLPDAAILFSKNKASVSFTDSAVDATNLTTYDFGTLDIGTAATGRCVIVAVACTTSPAGTNRTVTLTVGGNAATEVLGLSTPGSGNIGRTSIFVITIDSGTTANVTATFSDACLAASCSVWAAYGLNSTTPTDTASDQTSPLSTTIDVEAGGICVAYLSVNGTSGTTTNTWSGLTEVVDEQVETTSSHTGASDAFVGAQTGMEVAVTPSTFGSGTLVLAAFR